MLRNLLYFIACRFANFLAWGIGFVSVNHVKIDSAQSGSIIKGRSIWNWFPVAIGNLFFRLRQPSIQVLPLKEWIHWEIVVAGVLGRSVEPMVWGVRTKILPGETLAELLKQDRHSEQQKRDWVVLAGQALAELHQQSVELESFGSVALSHADASVCNVMIEPVQADSIRERMVENQRANWFDFDLRHDLHVSAIDRQADDLRALIFTALVCCRWNEIGYLLNGLKLVYPNCQVWHVLRNVVANPKHKLDTFHLAQLRRANGSTRYWCQTVALVDLIQVEATCVAELRPEVCSEPKNDDV
jgi:hypothetical protein